MMNNVNEIIEIARTQANISKNGSALVCLADAESLVRQNREDRASLRALTSIKFSVGIFHESYKLAEKLFRGKEIA